MKDDGVTPLSIEQERKGGRMVVAVARVPLK